MMAFEPHYSYFLTGLEEQEAKSPGCGGTIAPTNESGLIPQPQDFNAALSSPRTSFSLDQCTSSGLAGNAECFWPFQNEAPISWDEFSANFGFPSNSHYSLPETNDCCFAVDHDSFLESSFVWPLKNPENLLPERSWPSLACNTDYNASEVTTPRFYYDQGVESHPSYLNGIDSGPLMIPAGESDLYETTLSDSMFCSQDAAVLDVQVPEALRTRTQRLPRVSNEGVVDLSLGEFEERQQIPCRAFASSPETSHLGGYAASGLSRAKNCLSLVSTAPQGFSGASLVTPKASSGPNLAVPRFNELLSNFDASIDARPLKRKRKTFGAEDRKKVHAVRKTHACISCRSRKISVRPALLLHRFIFTLIDGSALRMGFANIASELLKIRSWPSKSAYGRDCKILS